jgi:archaea-specific DNA-binding protein
MPKHDNSTVYIGKKEMLNYVLATVMNLNSDQAMVIIKARGNSIGMAVDVAEIVRRRYVRNAILKDVKIGTELLDSNRGGKSPVSFIEIHLTRPPGEISTPAAVPASEPAKPQHHPKP